MKKVTSLMDMVRGLSAMSILLALFTLVFTFTACSDDDDENDSDKVTISDDDYEVSGKIGGHYYVDLGLSVKWADRNIGALSSAAYGDYFAWGETETKSTYTGGNSKTYGVSMADISGNAEYDAATANWGSKWRMPTYDEFEELIEKCSWVWTSRNGFNGYLVTGPNTNSIFLPAAGGRNGTSLNDAGEYGLYWSSTPYEGHSDDACSLYFRSSYHSTDWFGRYGGRTVRPVSE